MDLDENVVVDSDHDIAIELSGGSDSVTYVVHCIPPNFPNIKITKKQAGVSDGLMFFTPARNPFPRTPAFLAIMDNNGVPRFVRPSPERDSAELPPSCHRPRDRRTARTLFGHAPPRVVV